MRWREGSLGEPEKKAWQELKSHVFLKIGPFKESLQKCLRSLEMGRSGLGGDGKPWRIGTEVYGDRDLLPRDVITRKLTVPNAERIFFIRHALRTGFTLEAVFNLTKIDRWFLVPIKEVVNFEEELAGAKN